MREATVSFYPPMSLPTLYTATAVLLPALYVLYSVKGKPQRRTHMHTNMAVKRTIVVVGGGIAGVDGTGCYDLHNR